MLTKLNWSLQDAAELFNAPTTAQALAIALAVEYAMNNSTAFAEFAGTRWPKELDRFKAI
jgi:hypothetical protein